MAVCRRSDHDFGRDRTGRSRPVLDEERLTEALRQPLTQRTRDDVGRSAGGEADDNPHRPRRIGLRPCDARHGGQRGSAGGQMQKISAGKFHWRHPP